MQRAVAVTILLATFACGPKETTKNAKTKGPVTAMPPVSNADSLIYLDLSSPIAVQPMENRAGTAETVEFVEVEIVSVHNPGLRALTFEVRYQPKAGEVEYIGSFSLYPADNPGKFIVATQGKLRGEGEVILTMRPVDLSPADSIRVSARRIRFI